MPGGIELINRIIISLPLILIIFTCLCLFSMLHKKNSED
jgi:hypothetical protein